MRKSRRSSLGEIGIRPNAVHQKIGHGGEKTFREAQNKWANVTQETCHIFLTPCLMVIINIHRNLFESLYEVLHFESAKVKTDRISGIKTAFTLSCSGIL
ncbi:KRAB-A domain-containing protein 2 [Trichinella spiralis]|uniref:KRAB-A domain-containing protein 2 n=1 Tax=Trichinella spiralis TaxID=6334 RepID=UPI0001EFC77D|nr:KRAB-A domain-containing protein 2 [Trichinella spiralis]